MAVAVKDQQSVRYVLGKAETARLKILADMAPKRSSQKILECILFQSVSGVLVASVTDHEIYATCELCELPFEESEAHMIRVAVPAKTVKTWKPGTTLTLSADGLGKYSANGLSGSGSDATRFPKTPDLMATLHELNVTREYFIAMAACSTHASHSEIRPILQAVTHRGDKLVSTDALRLLQCAVDVEPVHDLKIPACHASGLAKLFEFGAHIAYDAYYVRFDDDGLRVYTKQTDGTYPQVNRLFTNHFVSEGEIPNVKEWIDALKLAKRTAEEIQLDTDQDGARIVARGKDGEEFAADVPYSGGSMTIHFNPVYLADSLQALGDGCTVHFAGQNAVATLKNKDGSLVALVSSIIQR